MNRTKNKESNFCFAQHGQVKRIFEDEDPESALEAEIDGNLKGSYRSEDVFKVRQLTLKISFIHLI